MTWEKKIPANPVVAVAGATGAVGQEFMNVLHDLDFPASEVRALASARSAGKTIPFVNVGLFVTAILFQLGFVHIFNHQLVSRMVDNRNSSHTLFNL